MEEDRLIDSELDEEEIQYDNKLRPDKLTEYICLLYTYPSPRDRG